MALGHIDKKDLSVNLVWLLSFY